MLVYPTPAVNVPAIRDRMGQNAISATVTTSEGSSASNDSIKGQLLNIILPTPGSLPESANQLAKPARALLMRLLEKDPKVRLRNLRQLQQSAFYLGFNFERIKSKKMSPKCVLENHLASKSSADLYNAKNIKKQEFIEFDQEAVLL